VSALLTALALAAQLPLGAGLEVHGERDVFTAPGVTLAWGVLRGPIEDETQVVIRVVLTLGPYYYVRLYGIDPFSGDRRLMAASERVPDKFPGAGLLPRRMIDLRTPRHTFAGHPRREIRLYRTEGEWSADVSALTIYYLGVPDTTPEFVSEPALTTYLDGAVRRANP